MSKKTDKAGPRGLDPGKIVKAAVTLMEKSGANDFSVRKVAAAVSCDPMAVMYHFGSKEGLERAMADYLNAMLEPVDEGRGWRDVLVDLAVQYRRIATKYPRTFPLLQKFWVTGPADFRHAEVIYRALESAGVPPRDRVDLCFGWYASVLGLATAEAGGLLKPAGPEILKEIEALDPGDYPATRALQREFKAQDPERIYTRMVGILLDGMEGTLAAGTTCRPGRRKN